MKRTEFSGGVSSAHSVYRELGLLTIAKSNRSLDASDAFMSAALDPRTKYTQLYRIGLENRDYNFILSDFSYFQFYFSERDARFGLRYCYCPNPYSSAMMEKIAEDADLASEGPDFDASISLLGDAEEDPRKPAIRYDVAYNQYRELVHPTAHFHFGFDADNRWPAERILGPLAFSLLIAKLFYPEAWAKGDAENDINDFDKKILTERVLCEVIDSGYFSAVERRQFFFA